MIDPHSFPLEKKYRECGKLPKFAQIGDGIGFTLLKLVYPITPAFLWQKRSLQGGGPEIAKLIYIQWN